MRNICKNLDLQDLDGETWKDIKDYEDLYQISNFGRIKSFIKYNGTKCRILKQNKYGRGYFFIILYKNKKRKYKLIHRLILESFKPIENSDNFECNHVDGNKENNFVENLEWCTPSENIKHAFEIGLKSNKGEKNPNTKLTKQKIIQIKLLIEKKLKQKEIAKISGVSQQTISMIKTGSIWNDIKSKE